MTYFMTRGLNPPPPLPILPNPSAPENKFLVLLSVSPEVELLGHRVIVYYFFEEIMFILCVPLPVIPTIQNDTYSKHSLDALGTVV